MKTTRNAVIARRYKAGRDRQKTYFCDGCGLVPPYMPDAPDLVLRFKGRVYHVHHVVPLWAGGADNYSNMTLLCLNCHAIAHMEQPVGDRQEWRGSDSPDRLAFLINTMFRLRILSFIGMRPTTGPYA